MGIVGINLEYMEQLLERALHDPRMRVTENLSDKERNLQALITAMVGNSYVRPHRHPEKAEIIIPLRGDFIVIEYDDNERVLERFRLGEKSSLRQLYIERNIWHTLVGVSVQVVYSNPTEGPYNEDSHTEYAKWAPDENSPESIMFLFNLKKSAL